jgi:hypothetical protein
MNFLGMAARVPLASVSYNGIRGVKWKGNVSYRTRPLIAISVETIRTFLYQVGNLFLNELIVATKELRNCKCKVYNTFPHLTRPKGAVNEILMR